MAGKHRVAFNPPISTLSALKRIVTEMETAGANSESTLRVEVTALKGAIKAISFETKDAD